MRQHVKKSHIGATLLHKNDHDIWTQRDGYQDSNGLPLGRDREEDILTSQNTSLTSLEGGQEEREGGIHMVCSTPSYSHYAQQAARMLDSVGDDLRCTRSLSMEDTEEEDTETSPATIRTSQEDGSGGEYVPQEVSEGEPSVDSGENYTTSATGKHRCISSSNDIMEGSSDDSPLAPVPAIKEGDKPDSQEDRVAGGSGVPGDDSTMRQPGGGEQEQVQGGVQGGCSYYDGGTCRLHGPGAKLHWKPVDRRPAP